MRTNDFDETAEHPWGRKYVDRSVPRCGPEKVRRIDEGLERLCAAARPGVPLTLEEIAKECGCTDVAIWQIEQRALRKLRRRIRWLFPELEEALQG